MAKRYRSCLTTFEEKNRSTVAPVSWPAAAQGVALEQNLRIRLTHVRAEGASVEVLNLPRDDVFMSPMRMKALAGALVQAAEDCERTIKGRMLSESVELEYEIRFFEAALKDEHSSLLVKLVNTFGVGRFTTDEFDQILNPNRHSGFRAKDWGMQSGQRPLWFAVGCSLNRLVPREALAGY